MDRRSFLRSMIGGVAAAAAVRIFPFRVFSFPKDLLVAPPQVAPGHLRVALELMPDSVFDVESFIRAEFGRRFAEIVKAEMDAIIYGVPPFQPPPGLITPPFLS